MEKKDLYKNYLIVALSSIAIVLLIVVIILILNKNDVFSFNNDKKNNDLKENAEIKDIKENTNTIDNSNNDNNQNKNTNVDTNSNTNTNNNNSNSQQPIETKKNVVERSESSLLSYFESQVNSINSNNNQEDSSLRSKIKNGFIDVVDFIFYNKEIKGYTFSELTQTAKIKVIGFALKMDNKIEKYFPNYKENIKDKYNDIKGKLAVKYIEVTDSLCKSVGEENCSKFKTEFSNMKTEFGLAWSLVKELATDGASNIKQIYESWRDSK